MSAIMEKRLLNLPVPERLEREHCLGGQACVDRRKMRGFRNKQEKKGDTEK